MAGVIEMNIFEKVEELRMLLNENPINKANVEAIKKDIIYGLNNLEVEE